MSNLDKRLEELENMLAKATPGSELYTKLREEYTALKECSLWEEELSIERDKTEYSHEENMLQASTEAKSKSVGRDILMVTGTTLVPFGLYMIWEATGHIISGRAVQWVGKMPFPFRR